MNILSVDTTGYAMSIALLKEGNFFSATKPIGLKNYESLVSLIAALMKKAALSIDDIDCLSVCIGPGSFTGIRIGVSAIKALAYAIEVPVVGYKSLDLDAWMLKGSCAGLVCVLRDARRNNVYAALYTMGAGMRRASRYFLCTFEELAASIERIRQSGVRGRRSHNSALFFYGDAVALHRPQIQSRFPYSMLLAQKSHYQNGRAMISLTMEGIDDAVSAFCLAPFYMYPRDCQVHKSAKKQ